MGSSKNTVAVYPGTFDPITWGHLDVIRRGRALFDGLIVAVGNNPEKAAMFTTAERVEMIRELVSELEDVSVEPYEDLTVEFVRRVGAKAILRGIRDSVDLRDELQFANTNLLVGGVETVFLMTSDQHALTSSTLIRQIVGIGGYEASRLERLVPLNVARRLEAKLRGAGR